VSISSGRSLRRSHGNRWIAGVCGGLGEFFGIALIQGGIPGLLLYVVLWIIVPNA
jgi:phage shock protein C